MRRRAGPTIAPDGSQGTLESSGALEFLQLGGGTVSSEPKARTVAVAGVPSSLDAATAQSFEELCAKAQGKDPVFSAGEAPGSVSFSAPGRLVGERS